MAAMVLKRLPLLHNSADYVFIFFEIIELILVTLKFEYRLSWSCGVRWAKGAKGAYKASQTT